MLQSLYIRNYVLIERLEMQFSDGFTTITGETGAGKSILMGALGLILGQRVDTSVLKLKDAKCIVEGSFKGVGHLRELFAVHELDFEEFTTLRREIAPGGKSRAFVNDTPVTLPVLRDIGKELVDIHSQYQSLQLGDQAYQLDVVDYLAGNRDLLARYRVEFERFQELDREIARIRSEAEKLREDLDYMQFQYDELHAARLKEGELQELEADFQRAEHAEEIGNALQMGSQSLLQEGSGILDQLREILGQMKKIAGVYGPAEEIAGRLESVYIELKDISMEVEDQAGRTELDPGALSQLQERIDLIYGLMQKHRKRNADELISLREELSGKIEDITFSDEKVGSLEKERDRHKAAMKVLAEELHKLRTEAGNSMQKEIVEQLKQLGISHARFKVSVDREEGYIETGFDRVRFLFSANKQVEMEEVSRVASGGEISRLMLCIKALISDRQGMPTLIFDEIDTGVGGEIAEKFGNIMRRLAASRQVMAITHLPQVASIGSDHFVVYKEDTKDANYTRIRRLNQEERIEEIARMLSGESVTPAAISNARELLRV